MKTWFMNLSLAKKQVYVLLVSGLLPMLLVSVLALTVANSQLQKQAFDQLNAVRDIKSAAIQRYFESVENQILAMADSPHIVNAAGAFSRSFHRVIQAENISDDDIKYQREQLALYYANQFAEKYQKDNEGKQIDTTPLLNGISDDAAVLQYAYIQNNPHPLGEKHLLNSAEGKSVYHRAHEKYHAGIRQFLEKFGYYDIFIVDSETGDLVYSVFKELDFGTSLKDGPYANSNLAVAFQRALTLPHGEVAIQDFQTYLPSYDAPASFISTPISYEGSIIGILIFQMPLEPINTIMASREGMGKTGDSFLVGSDNLMRSDSFADNKHHSVFGSFRNPDKGSVKSFSTQNALAGKTGYRIIRNHYGDKVLSTYSPIQIKDFTWAAITEISTREAFSGITLLGWTLSIIALLGAVIIAFFAFAISRVIAKPILALSKSIQKVERQGNFQLLLTNTNTDEVGATCRAFNSLLNNLSTSITGTNIVLEELSKGNYDERVSEDYPGQLGSLTRGVNVAIEQVKQATMEQEKQATIAKNNAERAAAAAEKAQQQATETLIIKQALDVSATSTMIADKDFNIVYMNASIHKLMADAEANLRREIPGFSAQKLMGINVDIFHKNPEHQRKLIQELTGTYKTQVDVAELNFNFSATPIRDASGTFLGVVAEWENITEQLAKAKEDTRIANENARIRQALDSSSTSTMIADENASIIYTNSALNAMMENAEEDLRSHLGNFNAKNLLGSNMDSFHKNPQHQRDIINNLTTAYKGDVVAGNRTFTLTANPITNPNGDRIGTVVEWLDRTEEVAIEGEIDKIITAAAAGDFSQTLNLAGKKGFFLKVSEGLNRLLSTTDVALEDIIRVFSALAKGDLSQTIDRNYQGEFAQLKKDANTTTERLREIIENIASASGSITRSAAEISAGNADLSQRTEEQASSLEETASSMEEMITIVRQSEQNARQANKLALDSVDIARKGDESVKATAKAMAEISNASTKIANIIGVIDEIAFQTNLLALNAAVEAARAGEQGRGFAVVAAEVRNLAQRSASAAKEIKALIQDSVNKVNDGSELVEASGHTLQLIVKEIEKVGNTITQIANSAREQTEGIEQVNKAVGQMDQMTQQNAALVEEASAASESMAAQAREMDEMIAFFRK